METEQTNKLPHQLDCNQRFIRVPAKGYCPNSGLSRSHIFDLIKQGEIQSRSLVKPGNIRGIRVVWLPSLLEYIEQMGAE